LQPNMRFPQTWNAWKFALFKMHTFTTVETYFFVPEPLWNLDDQKLLNFKIDFLYRSVISPFAVKLFLLPFGYHCSTQNIDISDSGYVIKPPLPSSAICGAPPFTANRGLLT